MSAQDEQRRGRVAYEAYGQGLLKSFAPGTPLEGLAPSFLLCPWSELTVTVRGAWTLAADAVLNDQRDRLI